MIDKAVTRAGALGVALALLAAGCGKSPPPLTEVTGTVLLNNQPLPHARVQFYPDLDGPGGDMVSSAVTNDQGQFTLTCDKNGQPGAVVARHRVVVTEGPPPPEARGMSETAQKRLAAFQQSLKNRPIPANYGNVNGTPLTIEVKADQKDYTVPLNR